MLSVISLTVMAPDTTLFQELVKEINIKIQPHPTLEHFLQKKIFYFSRRKTKREREYVCVRERGTKNE
jgi:hypothetical protein